MRIKFPKLGKSRDCLLRKEQKSREIEDEFKRIFWKVMKESNWKPEDFAAKETKEEQSVSSRIYGVHSENKKPRENHLLLRNVHSLQHRVNNLSIKKRKMSFARFKVKQRNLFGLALIDTGNLVHSWIVSGKSLEAIGGKISNSMDYKVGTADSQSEGLQGLGIGDPWPIYLEGMEECYIPEPLVIRGLNHSVNLGTVE